MNNLCFPVLCVVIFLRFNCVAKGEKYDALIFNQGLMKLDQLEQDDAQKQCQSCLTACPGSLEQGVPLSYIDTLTIDTLFFQKFYKNPKNMKEIELKICSKPFKPAMVYDCEQKSYDIGYELYYTEGTTKLPTRDYKNLRKIIHNILHPEEPVASELVTRYTDNRSKITKFKVLGSDRRLVFSWLSALSIQFDGSQRHVRFEKDVINGYKTMGQCEDYIIGDERVLNIAKKVVEKSSPPKLTRGHSESLCHHNESCLEKTQIMPMNFLHTDAAKLATCAHINLALIWEKIAKGHLKKVDEYLYAVLRHWYSSVKIIFGVSGEYPLEKDEINIQDSEDIREQATTQETLRKIPIPIVIYRIVEYFSQKRIYQVLIVIHNNRGEVKVEDRICPEESEVTGWDRIKNNEGEKIGLSYACEVTAKTIGKLGKYGATETKSPGVLKLNEFPQDNGGLFAKVSFTDETQNVDDEYDKIFPKIQSKL